MKAMFRWFDGLGNSRGISNPGRRSLLKSLPALVAIPIAIEMEDRTINAKAVPLDLTTRYLIVVDSTEDRDTVDSLRICLSQMGVSGVIYPTNKDTNKALQIYKLESDIAKS